MPPSLLTQAVRMQGMSVVAQPLAAAQYASFQQSPVQALVAAFFMSQRHSMQASVVVTDFEASSATSSQLSTGGPESVPPLPEPPPLVPPLPEPPPVPPVPAPPSSSGV